MQKLVVNNEFFFPEVVALLEKGQRVIIPVKGYSMLPFIRGEKDLVELEGVRLMPKASEDALSKASAENCSEAAQGKVSAENCQEETQGKASAENCPEAALDKASAGKSAGVLLETRPLEEGDIVLFRMGGKWVMHRLLSIQDGIAEIMGDGVIASREHCPVDQIFGRAVTILRSGRHAVDPRAPWQQRKARWWRKALPVRRYLLIAWRLLPWNWWILRSQHAPHRA